MNSVNHKGWDFKKYDYPKLNGFLNDMEEVYIYIWLYIYIIKQDIRLYIYTYVAYSKLNGWTEWAEIFCGHSWVAGGVKG